MQKYFNNLRYDFYRIIRGIGDALNYLYALRTDGQRNCTIMICTRRTHPNVVRGETTESIVLHNNVDVMAKVSLLVQQNFVSVVFIHFRCYVCVCV